MYEDFIKNLRWRGMIHDMSPNVENYLNKFCTTAYLGFDLTANSLHIGNLASIMLLKHLQNAGHKPIVLIGGATSMIGDPSFKQKERVLISPEELNYRRECISAQLSRFLRYDDSLNSALLLDNIDWFGNMGVIDFLRDVGKHITVNYMKAKESVKQRMETGISYTEFTYQLFQAYDFYYLNRNFNVKLQLGGSDQWGNLTTGIELIRRKCGEEVFAITTPLITKADGSKFGKSERGGNVWLDPKLTSPYEFYQFWLNCTDDDAARFIRVFTTLSSEEIDIIIFNHNANPEMRTMQKLLARLVTSDVHSDKETKKAERTSEILFSKKGDLLELEEAELLAAFSNLPQIHVSKEQLMTTDISSLLSSITNNKIFESKSEVRRFIKNGGLLVNKSKIVDATLKADKLLIYNRYIVVQKGKKNYYLIVCE
jgi:tyrosyl-tRNA synthetase